MSSINTSSKELPISDIIKFILAMLLGFIKTVSSIIFKGIKRKSWNWKLQLVIGISREPYNFLAKFGPERYQNVLERILPEVKITGPKIESSIIKEIPGHWFYPKEDNGSIVLYLHGGGYVYGSIKTHGQMIGLISSYSSSKVIALDYRLAPKNPKPAAIEDSCTAYRYLVNSGVQPEKIIIAGDSAGGGLVISTLIALRDNGDKLPAGGICISPWVNLECNDKSFEYNSGYDAVTKEACLVAASAYLNENEPKDFDVSPLFADLKGLPPLLIQVGELEVLFDQISEFAAKAKSQNVETEFTIYKDMVHVWHMYFDFTNQADKAYIEIADFIKAKTLNK